MSTQNIRSGILKAVIAGIAGLMAMAATPALAHGPEDGHAHAIPPWQDASPWPDRIVATLTADPAHAIAVTWRTDASAPNAQAQIARATPDARFDQFAETYMALSEPLDLTQVPNAGSLFAITDNAGLEPVVYHSVTFTDLEPNTLYAYRVRGAENVWSEWFQIRTAPTDGPVSFIYLGDAQNGILTHWARTVRQAYATAPHAGFILHAGDLVDRGSRDFEWAQWFRAVGFIHAMVPAAPVAGNHEYFRVGLPEAEAQRLLSILWRPQWTLPQTPALQANLQETVYEVRYTRDLHIFVLDTQGPDLEAQAAWLNTRLQASDARWRVVSFHHPVFSSGRDRDDVRRREILLPVLRANNVDLVLQGHDHTYARGALAPQTPQRTAEVGTEGGIGPMFVNSVSGAKMYNWRENRWDDYADEGVTLDRLAENTQFYQVIDIDGPRLTYRAFTADGQLYDAFMMEKDAAGARRLLQGPVSTMGERRFENTFPYPGTDGLNN
ncbi:MAG: metallophosphoesterase [Caulobacterales bacterium]|jgi:hypothetical protein